VTQPDATGPSSATIGLHDAPRHARHAVRRVATVWAIERASYAYASKRPGAYPPMADLQVIVILVAYSAGM